MAQPLKVVPDADDEKIDLGRHKGRDILSVGMEIPGASGGLNESLAIDPVKLRHGQRVRVVLDCEVDKERYDRIKDTDALREVYILKVEAGMIASADVDEAAAADLEAQAERIRLAKEGAAPLPGMSKAGIEPDIDPDGDPMGVWPEDPEEPSE